MAQRLPFKEHITSAPSLQQTLSWYFRCSLTQVKSLRVAVNKINRLPLYFRYGHSTVTVENAEDGRDLRMILVFGGMDEAGNYLCDLYAFEPSNNTWTLVDAREKVPPFEL